MTAAIDADLRATLQAILGHLTRTETRLDRIEARLGELEVTVARMDGRLGQLPTLMQTILLTFAIMGGTFGGIAGLLALYRYLQ